MSISRLLLALLLLVVIFTSISLAIAVFVEGRAIDEVINTMAVKVPMLIGLLAVLAIVFRLIFRRLWW
jgi:lipopolysaccharide export LptBFGC system permease protein LptF